MSEVDRQAWLEAVQNEESFTRRRAILELRRDHFDDVWRRLKSIDWKPYHWVEAHSGDIHSGELRYGQQQDLPEIVPRVVDQRLDLRLRQMAINALQRAVLDDYIHQPEAPFLDSAPIVAELIVAYVCMPEPALRLTAASVAEQFAASCRPWFDPGRPPLEGIREEGDHYGYVERAAVWDILEERSVIFLPLMLDDYDAVRVVGARLLTHFPSVLNLSLELVSRAVHKEQSDYARDELAVSLAVLLRQSGQPLDFETLSLSQEAQTLISALREYPNFSPAIEQALDTMRRTLGCDRQVIGHGWRAHVLLTEANARKAGFTEYVSHTTHSHLS
jgi:hypothetical protein